MKESTNNFFRARNNSKKKETRLRLIFCGYKINSNKQSSKDLIIVIGVYKANFLKQRSRFKQINKDTIYKGLKYRNSTRNANL